jgi:fructoselysine 6-kinase
MAHTGYAAMLEDQLPQIAERLPVSFDFAVEPIAYAEPLLPHVKVASFSASHLDPRDCERLLRDASELGPVVVVGSRGAWGVMLLHRSKVYAHRCVPIEPTDTLGAGDALIARILVGLLAEEAPERLLAEATEAATAACRHFGAFGHGVPLWPDGPKLSADVTRNHW